MRTVIFHASCTDGFTAAWAAYRKFGDRDVNYVPAHYGEAPPVVVGHDVTIVDFSYTREVLEQMRGEAASLLVLDHHKTAESDLVGLPYCTFDMSRSGAGLAWDCLHAGAKRPALIDFVEDRDLWRWALPESREVSAWLSSWRFDFARWDQCCEDLENNRSLCVEQGAAILRAMNGYVDSLTSKSMPVLVGSHLVPCINTTHAQSELVGKLAEGNLFAAGWFQRNDGKFVYSLRSRGDFDVSEVARQYGGGGHKNAAGFTVDKLLPWVP